MTIIIIGASLSEPHIESDNVPHPGFSLGQMDTNHNCMYYTVSIMGRGSRPICRVGPKMPKTKWRLQPTENELIAYILAVQDICSILAT